MHTMWKGSISFGLVHIPIKLFAATEEKDIKLRYLHKKCASPIKYTRTCPICDETVTNDDIMKGYEYETGKFVPIEKNELDALKDEQTKAIEIIDFVQLEDIDPIYFNKSYFIGPNENGQKAYQLLKQAMSDSKKIGLAKLTLHSKTHLAVVRVYDKGLLLETIYFPDEVRSFDHIPDIETDITTSEKELKTAIQLIDQLTTPFEPEKYHDDYREELSKLIQTKIAGDDIKQPKKAPKKENVVDLLSALQASIDDSKPKQKKTTNKATKPSRKKKASKTS